MISKRIFDDIPPKMKILNMLIPILLHICKFVQKFSFATPGHVAQSVTCLATDAKLTADPWVASSIPVPYFRGD